MTFPNDISTITVTGFYPGGDTNPLPGTVTFTPSQPLTDSTGKAIIPAVPIPVKLSGGRFSVILLCTDNANVSPQGWYWIVSEAVAGVKRDPYFVELPHALGATVDLAALVPVSPGPAVSTLYGVLASGVTNTWQSTQDFTGPVQVNDGLTFAGTAIQNPPGGTTEFLRGDGSWAVPAGGSGSALQVANNLSDVADVSAARTHLGLTTAATLAVGTTAGTLAAGDDARIVGAAQAASLGTAASKNVGTATGTVAAGDDSRIVGAAQAASLGAAATKNVGTASGTVAAGDDSRITGAAQKSANLSDLTNLVTARANLGLNGPTTKTGVLAEVLPPGQTSVSGGSPLSSAVLILNLMRPGPILATNLGIWLTTAGVTATGANGLALYDEAGNLIDQTTDLSVQFATAGFLEAPMGAAHQLAADTNYYLAVLAHFTTSPKGAAAVAGQVLAPIKGHYVSLTKSSTASFPASFTPSSLVTSTATYYMTIS